MSNYPARVWEPTQAVYRDGQQCWLWASRPATVEDWKQRKAADEAREATLKYETVK